MGLIQAYKMAIKSILSNKVRAFLTMLGVIIGVAAVIAAVAFAEGSTKSITDSVQGLGTNLIQISITGRNSNRNVTYDDLLKLSDDHPDEITAIAPQIGGSVTVKAGVKSRSTNMNGTSPEAEIVKSMKVQSGRFLSSFDIDNKQKVAVIGTAIINDIYEGRDPINQQIKINGQVFTVIGVLEQKANGAELTEDDQVVIPINVSQRLMRNAVIRNFAVQAATPESVDAAMLTLNEYLIKIYKDAKSFRVFNQAQMLSTLSTVTDTLMIVLGGIATISLIVGGIGIMNIMLVSVTERTREIGIRKAIGAKKKNILSQFLIEALMVTGFGGFLGVTFGLSIIRFVFPIIKKLNSSFNIPQVYSMKWIMISFGISLIVGVVFGMFPAYKASNLNPIEALRHE